METRAKKKRRVRREEGEEAGPSKPILPRVQAHDGTKANLNRQETEHAILASEAYNTKYPNAQKLGYIYVPNLSDVDAKTFYKKSDNQAVIAFRGSQTAEDWAITDATLALNAKQLQHTERFTRHSKLVNRVVDHYGSSNVQLTGHSLGGTEAIFHGLPRDLHANAFNPGSTPHPDLKSVFEERAGQAAAGSGKSLADVYNNHNVHHVKSDPVSAFSSYSDFPKYTYAVPTGMPYYKAHNMKNFESYYEGGAKAAIASAGADDL